MQLTYNRARLSQAYSNVNPQKTLNFFIDDGYHLQLRETERDTGILGRGGGGLDFIEIGFSILTSSEVVRDTNEGQEKIRLILSYSNTISLHPA